jgi:RNA polymerase sigma factor (sigma-70 family)
MELAVFQYGDVELWQSFKKGNEDAFACLYERYAPVLYSYGCKINSDEDLVKDCLQDLFFNLWRRRESLADTDSVKYYLFCSFRREVIRKSNKEGLTIGYANDLTHDAKELSVEEMLILDEDEKNKRRLLTKALLQLSARQQEALHLRFYEDTSFEDIAVIMNITPRAVYKLIYRAIGALQKTYISSMGLDLKLLLVGLFLSLVRFA